MSTVVAVRATGRHGLRHWVYLDAGQALTTSQTALCGQPSARGWVVDPDHWTRDCEACERKTGEL